MILLTAHNNGDALPSQRDIKVKVKNNICISNIDPPHSIKYPVGKNFNTNWL